MPHEPPCLFSYPPRDRTDEDNGEAAEVAVLVEGLARTMSARPSAVELLDTPGALLLRGDLFRLGLTRAMVDAVFREIARTDGIVMFPGTRRTAVRVAAYRELLERSTYRDDGTRVWPT